jgi:hypothetical protein
VDAAVATFLSTPSLGITDKFPRREPGNRGCPFNSLSRDHERVPVSPAGKGHDPFQLPLSGSHDRLLENRGKHEGPRVGAFNSLSRDHQLVRAKKPQVLWLLSTPSLGITGSPYKLDGIREGLSTPSLGITSPIPGFSGSLRLSAAAPLRTNDS